MKSNHAQLALSSFQYLRGKAHLLLEARFPNKLRRYSWLKKFAPAMHISQMNKEELVWLINKLS
ncbi:MAG: hypothetical protein COY66_05820 [Candidatus Kerfeldbacteria bacterium CG_4_10_14_0_8_um_filter_42_10]|uniref:Uncharacterized protein n=1 Tax=Candidatus Kerfeldbacteria bacterium CG_4_10_14_0_8_um_filter_42_10 TaxID=2014248 RepID=A0A2M7RGG0_9BACT|nr:MAG: hypothetical protein COY66_05820 [Candidatus Kerfeldbacteria bacterium CG_4_10_14_0_8_um_filter_42_10]